MAVAKKTKPEQGNGKPALEIENVQAIAYARAELPEQGGVVVWRGRHGVGKTTSVRCVAALNNTEVRSSLVPRDGCDHGTIRAPGILVRIGRRNTASGELEMEMVDPECDPSVLVEPKLKGKTERDSLRLRMLVRVGQVEVTGEQWGCHLADVVPERVEEILAGIDPRNPVGSAEVVRARVHALALAAEQEAVRQTGRAETLAGQLAGVDLTVPQDPEMLQRAYEVALHQFSRVEAEAKQAREQAEAVEAARKKLAGVQASLPDVAAIKAEIDAAEARRSVGQQEVATIDLQIAELRRKREEAIRGIDTATQASADASARMKTAKAQHFAVAELRATVEGGVVDGPSLEVIEQARIAKEQAHAAILAGQRAREGQKTHADAEAARQAATASETRGKALRSLARSTDMVLEEALRAAGFAGLTWRDGRLYVESDRGLDGHLELFDDLSEGERYQTVFRWYAEKLPPSSFVPFSQEAWQGQLDSARQEIAAMCRAHKIWLWTGQIGDGDLRAEVFGGDVGAGVVYPVGAEN
jgi:hypothetical protein